MLLNGLLHLPLVLPPVVTGYLLLLSFGRQGSIGAFLYDGLEFPFPSAGQERHGSGGNGVSADAARIRLSFEIVDRRLEAAASTLGADLSRLFHCDLAARGPGILVGVILCFAKALGEFGATITFVSNIPGVTQTIPSAIYSYTQVQVARPAR